MKHKILLIRPNNFLSASNYPPLALVLIGSTLQIAGYEVEIYAASNEDDYIEAIREKVKQDDLLLVGLTVMTTEVADAVRISKEIKKISHVPVVWGGWHVTLFSVQCVETALVDFAIIDEGDLSIVELANNLAEGNPPINKIIAPKKHLRMEDLPYPNYSLISNIEDYITRPLTDKFQEMMGPARWLPYQSSRGCPGKCSFCINVVTDNQNYRVKSAEKVVEELACLINEYGINHFKILDDNFFVSRKRVRLFCELVIKRGLKFTWDGECRVDYFRDDYLNDDFLWLLRKTGLVQLVMGAESGSRKTLEYLCKEIVPEQTERAVKTLQRNGIIADCAFIVGLPGESKEELMATANLINRLRKNKLFLCGVQTYRPYPKSKIAEQLIREGKLKQPKALEEWCNEEIVGLYTYIDVNRPWIEEYELAMNISYYQSLASGVWLFQHQLDKLLYRFINLLFRKIGQFRSRYFMFGFPIEKKTYSYFRQKMYERQDRLAKEQHKERVEGEL